MDRANLLGTLEDSSNLLDAYAASSAYVMQKIFASNKALGEFKDRTDLAPALQKRVEQLMKEAGDPVVLSAHLYALGLTGDEAIERAAVTRVLADKQLREDPLAGQFAGRIGARLIRTRSAIGQYLSPAELETIFNTLRKKEEPQ